MKDCDNLSEVANVGDRQDMEDNLNFLSQQPAAQTISTGLSTPNMDSDAALCMTGTTTKRVFRRDALAR